MKNPKLNKDGYFVAEHYLYAEFMHEKELNHQKTIHKFNRRIGRFFNLIASAPKHFLHNIPVNSIQTENDIKQYVNSIIEFQTKLSPGSTLHIYLRFDENLTENKLLAEKLYSELQRLNIPTAKYIRGLKEFGILGVKSYYPSLLANLGIEIKVSFPRIYIK